MSRAAAALKKNKKKTYRLARIEFNTTSDIEKAYSDQQMKNQRIQNKYFNFNMARKWLGFIISMRPCKGGQGGRGQFQTIQITLRRSALY